MSIAIRRIALDEVEAAPLIAEGAAGDGRFLMRLKNEWEDGRCRFDAPGEFLLGAFDGAALIGIGGISLDPYHPTTGLGRVRHVYVLKAWRGRGVGRALVSQLVTGARAHFSVLRLRTQAPEAVHLYECVGFVRTDAPGETHRLVL
ncbi:MAG: GNAT family N-acetyltransferase [Pseudomonadota bacterium]|nr:GNAT family N-acetyltransferase [Pseudomonadota bacterium]